MIASSDSRSNPNSVSPILSSNNSQPQSHHDALQNDFSYNSPPDNTINTIASTIFTSTVTSSTAFTSSNISFVTVPITINVVKNKTTSTGNFLNYGFFIDLKKTFLNIFF